MLEMAGAYATLAADGVYHKPSFVDHIVAKNGSTIFTAASTAKRVLDPQIAREAVMTLRAVVQYGTGTGADLPERQDAGKTGTTELNTDAWFNGFTPQLATTVWIGDPKARTPMQYPATPIAVFGGTYPASIWHDYTEAALSGQPAIDFPRPESSKIPPGKFITSQQLTADSPTTEPPSTVAPPTTTPPSTVAVPTTIPVPGLTVPTVPTILPPSTPRPTTCTEITTPKTTIQICH